MARVGATGDPGMRGLRGTRRVRPTGRGIASLAIGAFAFVFAYVVGRSEYLVGAGILVLLPVLGLAYVRVRRPRLEIERKFSPPVVAVGGTVHVSLRIANAAPTRSTPLGWADALPWFEPIGTRELPALGPGRRKHRVVTYELHPERRGLYAIGPFIAEHEDPFGMATSVLALGSPDRLVVVPAASALGEGGPSLADGEGEARLVQRRVTGNDDDLTTREYRTGDALRRVHWRASARHGELMVRQEEHRSHPDARILVDTRRAGYGDSERDPGRSWSAEWASEGFEWVMRMVASLGLHLEGSGFRVAVEESARPQIQAIGNRGDGRRTEGFLTSLASVQLLDRGLDERSPAVDGTGPVFAVLGDPEDATVDWLISRRRAGEAGYAFLVAARPPVRERLREAGWVVVLVAEGDDPADAWRAAASERGALHGAR